MTANFAGQLSALVHRIAVPTSEASAAAPWRKPRTGFCILPSVQRERFSPRFMARRLIAAPVSVHE